MTNEKKSIITVKAFIQVSVINFRAVKKRPALLAKSGSSPQTACPSPPYCFQQLKVQADQKIEFI